MIEMIEAIEPSPGSLSVSDCIGRIDKKHRIRPIQVFWNQFHGVALHKANARSKRLDILNPFAKRFGIPARCHATSTFTGFNQARAWSQNTPMLSAIS